LRHLRYEFFDRSADEDEGPMEAIAAEEILIPFN